MRLPYRRINVSMGHPLAGSCQAHNMIKSIAHDQPQKNFKYLWLVLSVRSGRKCPLPETNVEFRLTQYWKQQLNPIRATEVFSFRYGFFCWHTKCVFIVVK